MKTKRTYYLMSLVMVASLALGLAATVNAQEGKGVELGETVVITAHVLAIDKEDRILTLQGSKKNIVDIEVGEEARNFDQIRVGDQLRIEYYESVALYLGKPGTQPEEDAGLVVARSAKGEKPSRKAAWRLRSRPFSQTWEVKMRWPHSLSSSSAGWSWPI